MNNKMLAALVLTLVLTVSGCVGPGSALGQPFANPTPTASAPAPTTPAPAATTAPATQPAASAGQTAQSSQSTAAASTTTSGDPALAAVQAVIAKANQEQQDAFAKNDPTVMKDTATSSYYNELVQINSDMASGGVSAIKLIKTEWGPVSLNGSTAQATTWETWQTTYSDGSSDQSRDRNVYTLVQDQGTWKIQSDEHPDSNLNQPGGPTGPSAVTPPAPSSPSSPSNPVPPVTPASDGVSRNWSGYAAEGGTYTSVTGTWTLPSANNNSNSGFGSSATWVGIGGVSSHDLIQAGTQQTSDGSGTVHYNAWIEMLPAASKSVPLTVLPGDSVTVSITQQSAGEWLIVLKNNTTGKNYQTTVQYQSSLSSAEWVQEAPSAGRRVVSLDQFGTVQFTSGSATKDGKKVTLKEAGAQPITMIDSQGNALAIPSSLGSDGSTFSVSRTTTTIPVVPVKPNSRGFSGQSSGRAAPLPATGNNGFTLPLTLPVS
jgi:hypothetical protein